MTPDTDKIALEMRKSTTEKINGQERPRLAATYFGPRISVDTFQLLAILDDRDALKAQVAELERALDTQR